MVILSTIWRLETIGWAVLGIKCINAQKLVIVEKF